MSRNRELIYQTREALFHLVSKHREVIYQTQELVCHLAPVIQKIDSAIHRINHYPVDKY